MVRLANNLVKNAERLKNNITTNQAERLMGLVAKFVGGKRVNFATGGGYERRCVGAALAHTSGPGWTLSPFRRMLGESPGNATKRVHSRRRKRHETRRQLFDSAPKKRRKLSNSNGPDKDYGPLAAAADNTEVEMAAESAKHVAQLAAAVATPELCAQIERDTVGQTQNPLWCTLRRGKITASKMHTIVKRRPETSCQNKV